MSIFQQLDFEIDNVDQRITINKIDCAANHFGNKDNIIDFLNGINALKSNPEKDSTDKDLLFYLYNFFKKSSRIEKVEFYRGKLALVVLVVSNRVEFQKVSFYKRNMTIEGKRAKFVLSIVEVLKSEYSDIESGKRKLPKSWKFDEELSKSYNRIRLLSQ